MSTTIKLISVICIGLVNCSLAMALEHVPASGNAGPPKPLADLLSNAASLTPGSAGTSFMESSSSVSTNGGPAVTTIHRSEQSSSGSGAPIDLKQSFEKFQQSAKDLYNQLQQKVNSSAIFSGTSVKPADTLRSATSLSQTSSSSSNPFPALANPFAGITNPFANLQNPLANAQNPFAGIQNPLANMQNPLAGIQTLGSQLGLPGAGPSPQQVTGGITGQNFGEKLVAAMANPSTN